MREFNKVSKEQFTKDFKGVEDLTKFFSNVEDIYNEIKLPKRATKKSAGYDCFAPFDIVLQPNDNIKIPTGIKAYMNDGEVLMAFPRSGLGFKYFCRIANTIGVIDGDYIESDNEGHIFIKLRNEGDKIMKINKGDGLCQFIFMPFLLTDNDSFTNGKKRNGGFGSTNKENK